MRQLVQRRQKSIIFINLSQIPLTYSLSLFMLKRIARNKAERSANRDCGGNGPSSPLNAEHPCRNSGICGSRPRRGACSRKDAHRSQPEAILQCSPRYIHSPTIHKEFHGKDHALLESLRSVMMHCFFSLYPCAYILFPLFYYQNKESLSMYLGGSWH